MNLSMNEAASHLKIGKTRLYQLVNEHKIEPTRRGRRRELSSEQLDNLKSIINFRVPEPEPSTEPPEPSEHFTLIEELKNQNKILLQQLVLLQEFDTINFQRFFHSDDSVSSFFFQTALALRFRPVS